MNYKGDIIEESLKDKSILDEVKIINTRIEEVTDHHRTPWLKQWTLHLVEIPEGTAESFAEKVSNAFETEHSAWYVDYKNDKWHFIIFPNKVFKIDSKSVEQHQEAKRYGISLGIPEHQVDFAPEDQVWER